MWVRILPGTLETFMWWSYPASLQNVNGSTQVPTHAWNNAQRGIWGLPPSGKLESCHITLTVLLRRENQPSPLPKKVIYRVHLPQKIKENTVCYFHNQLKNIFFSIYIIHILRCSVTLYKFILTFDLNVCRTSIYAASNDVLKLSNRTPCNHWVNLVS